MDSPNPLTVKRFNAMMIVSSTAEANDRAKEIDVLGEKYVLRGYVGAAPIRGKYVEGNEANDNQLPQGFLVDQPPGSITKPHFHETDQFQVFVSGDGRFGKQPAAPLTVQYANGHTPYGPIVAGDQGIRYFTLRKRWDPGAKYMPAMRAKLVRGRQRQFLRPAIAVSSEAARIARAAPATDVLIGPEPDGLLAVMMRLGPGQSSATPDAAEGGGQYHVVVAGSLQHQDTELAELSCQFAYPDEGRVSLRAGETGLEMLVLRFGREQSIVEASS